MKLWRRIAATLGTVVVVDVGSRIVIPGVTPEALARFQGDAGGGLLGLYALIAGGGLYRGAIAALGVMPYLTALAVMRLWRVVHPSTDRRGESAEGRHARTVRTRWMTAALSVIQSFGFATFLQKIPGAVANPGPGFTATTVLTLTSVSLVTMWLGESLTAKDESDFDDEVSEPVANPSAAPAPAALAPPASPLGHRRPSTDAETLHTRR